MDMIIFENNKSKFFDIFIVFENVDNCTSKREKLRYLLINCINRRRQMITIIGTIKFIY